MVGHSSIITEISSFHITKSYVQIVGFTDPNIGWDDTMNWNDGVKRKGIVPLML